MSAKYSRCFGFNKTQIKDIINQVRKLVKDGKDGKKGKDGKDGITKIITGGGGNAFQAQVKLNNEDSTPD